MLYAGLMHYLFHCCDFSVRRLACFARPNVAGRWTGWASRGTQKRNSDCEEKHYTVLGCAIEPRTELGHFTALMGCKAGTLLIANISHARVHMCVFTPWWLTGPRLLRVVTTVWLLTLSANWRRSTEALLSRHPGSVKHLRCAPSSFYSDH